jgi:hypothetical protein
MNNNIILIPITTFISVGIPLLIFWDFGGGIVRGGFLCSLSKHSLEQNVFSSPS